MPPKLITSMVVYMTDFWNSMSEKLKIIMTSIGVIAALWGLGIGVGSSLDALILTRWEEREILNKAQGILMADSLNSEAHTMMLSMINDNTESVEDLVVRVRDVEDIQRDVAEMRNWIYQLYIDRFGIPPEHNQDPDG